MRRAFVLVALAVALGAGWLLDRAYWRSPTIPHPITTTTTRGAWVLPSVPESCCPVSDDAYNDVPVPVIVERVARITWRTTSTRYCLPGGTRGGVAVALDQFARLRGSRWRVLHVEPPIWPPIRGNVYVVADKGPRAKFDMWHPSCAEARRYGARTITVERVS